VEFSGKKSIGSLDDICYN